MEWSEKSWNEFEKKIIEKSKFYFSEKLKAHVLTIPKGTFKNGLFASELTLSQNSASPFFWFIEDKTKFPIRLFLAEIYDIQDYRGVENG
jgi:hypothetical protein